MSTICCIYFLPVRWLSPLASSLIPRESRGPDHGCRATEHQVGRLRRSVSFGPIFVPMSNFKSTARPRLPLSHAAVPAGQIRATYVGGLRSRRRHLLTLHSPLDERR